MEYKYKAKNICAHTVVVELDGDVIKSARLEGRACPGNSKALSKFVEGMKISKLDAMLGGNTCGAKPTSCIDQIIQAAKEAYKFNNK